MGRLNSGLACLSWVFALINPITLFTPFFYNG